MIDAGDTAWLITATALVLFMTLPGLALFYGGLVRAENLLSVLMQCFAIACLVSVAWLAGAYSLAFNGAGAWIGNLDKALLLGLPRDAVAPNTTLPETVFFMFQMTFAIITPALIVGAFVERMRFGAVLLFSLLWLLLVYVPVAHWVWGGGWLAQRGVLDFAGGLVVHLTAGISALVLAVMLGPRIGFPDDVRPPHAPWMTMAGACMLWVGWFGFNAGSALNGGRRCRHGHDRHPYLGGHRHARVDRHRMDEVRQAEHGRRRHRGDRRAGLHHARFRLRRPGRRAHHRHCRRRHLLRHGRRGETPLQDRRLARRIRRPWRGRRDRGAADGRVHRCGAGRGGARRGPQHERAGRNSTHRDRRHFAMVARRKLRHRQGRPSGHRIARQR